MRRFKLLWVALFVVAGVYGFNNRWQINDWWRLRNYSASAEIKQLTEETSMSNSARNIFYASYPKIITDKKEFANLCSGNEHTIVLGCIVDRESIFLYNIKEERLKGSMSVTAAHEMLHAAYYRLSGSEKNHINKLLNSEYEKISDKRIRDTIDNYKKNDADIENELHSILGTEVTPLSEDLEKYYSKYFTDRKLVVTTSQKYENEFTKRKNLIEQLDVSLGVSNAEIDRLQRELSEKLDTLHAERDRLDSLLNNGSVDKYNSGIQGFNNRVEDYNSQANTLQVKIDNYNQMILQRNELSVEQNSLLESIDSRVNLL